MKIALSILVILLLGMGLNAQPVAKKFIVGGSIGYYCDKGYNGDQKISNETSLNFSPKVGYFISERAVAGFQFKISNNKSNESYYYISYPYSTEIENTEYIFSAAPYLRYYLISGNAGVFIEGSVSIGKSKMKREYSSDMYFDSESEISKFYMGISPGAYYFINPKILLEASAGWLGYNYESEDTGSEKIKNNKFGFDLKTTGLSLGLMFVF